jgi:DNA-binding XRE family transcriptional regulator
MIAVTDTEDIYTDLGLRIRKAREVAKISQEILADQLGLTRASIVNIEGGRQRPMLHTILKICQVLQTDLNHLLPDYISKEAEDPGQLIAAASATPAIKNIVTDGEIVDSKMQDAVMQFMAHLKK